MTGDDDKNDKFARELGKLEPLLDRLDKMIGDIDTLVEKFEKKTEEFEKKMQEPEKPRFLTTNKRIILFLVLLYMGTYYLLSEHETVAQKLSSLTIGALIMGVFVFIGWVALKIIGDGKPPKPPV